MKQVDQKSERTRLYCLNIISNLSLREALRPQILQNNAIEILIAIIKKEQNLFTSIDAQRGAAKALVNLISARRELRLKVVTQLSE